MCGLQVSSVLNKKNTGPANHAFEQREVLLNNTYPSIDAYITYNNISEHTINVFDKGRENF